MWDEGRDGDWGRKRGSYFLFAGGKEALKDDKHREMGDKYYYSNDDRKSERIFNDKVAVLQTVFFSIEFSLF